MPYGSTRTRGNRTRRRSYLSRTKARRSTRVARARAGGNAKVARAQTRAYVPKIVKNTDSIYTLAKQVRRLQRSQLGLYQKRYEESWMRFASTGDGLGFADRVVFCALNDFSDTARWYRGAIVNNAPTIDTIVNSATDAHWRKWTPQSANSTSDKYNYWVNSNNDVVSPVCYLPIRTMVTLTFDLRNMAPGVDPMYIRVMVIKQKKTLLHTTARSLNLPSNFNALAGMAKQFAPERNRINKEYLSVHYDKWIKLNNGQDTQKDIQRTVRVPMRFPNKLIKVESVNPIRDNDPESIEPAVLQGFTTNVEPDQVYYLALFASRPRETTEGLYVFCNRFNAWRDQHDVAA